MLAADAQLQVGPRRPARRHRPAHERADAGLVDRLERVVVQQAQLQVAGEEAGFGVVAAEAERRLGEVVRAEREELGVVGDLARREGGAWQLDHRAEEVGHLRARLPHRLAGDAFEQRSQPPELTLEADERDHDLRMHRHALLGHGRRGAEDRPHLHLVHLRVEDAQVAAAQAEHWVDFAQRVDLAEHRLLRP